jgi:tol-pal system protein YbgF
MHYLYKTLVASGLALITSLLSLTARAQDYVDVEAERAAATSSAAPADPYGAKPAKAYPVTSYGINSAPAGSAVAPAAAPAVPASGQNLGSLFTQIQQLQQEVMRLNGKVEEQAHELRKLKEQSLERYMDLDKRLSGAAVAPVAGTAVGAAAGAAATGQPAVTAPVIALQSPGMEQPGEGAAYNAAYALVRNQQFDQAVTAFLQFQRDYPAGRYAPNAYYWLGELYLVVQPPDLESSRQSFMMLLSQYPDNSKAPDALYKLGKVQYMKGNPEKAREYLDEVISKYGSTNSSAVKLARDFIAENY